MGAAAGAEAEHRAPCRPRRGADRRAGDPQRARAGGLILAGTVGHPERVPPAAAARLVRAYAHGPDFPAVNAAMRAGHFTELAEIDVPVTLAWPEHDRLVAGRGRCRPRSATSH